MERECNRGSNTSSISDEEKQNFELNASCFGSFIVFSLFIIGIAFLMNSNLPEPLNTEDASIESQRFIAERAYINLVELSGIGPKVVGTYENEVLAIEYLKKQIEEIIQKTQKNLNKITYDHQIVSGCSVIQLKGVSRLSCYENVQNIIVKLQPVENVTETILLNCHFDSVATSPGASDDNLHCAVMLEILRILSGVNYSFKKTMLFLFNGAEEDGLLASHGFVTQHRWAEEVTCFINLEACGAGGREILFQTGPNAYILPKIYSESVPYPHGNVVGEELFQSGVLPSDTDFRIFRDYGKLKGLDFAHYKNGYVYHTRDDDIDHTSKNVIQHSGSNILSLVNGLVAYDNLKDAVAQSEDQAIFFDLFGKFMICYSTTMSYVINAIAVIFSIYMSTYTTVEIFKGMGLKHVYYHFTINFVFVGVGSFIISQTLYFLASLLKWKSLTMLWYSNPWFVITYYGIPTLYMMVTLMKIRQNIFASKLKPQNEAKLFIIITQMINTFFLFIGTIFKLRSIYIIMINLVSVSCSHYLLNKTRLKKTKVETQLMVFTICNFISSLYVAYFGVQCFTLIIPMMGRIGMKIDSEMVIWIVCELFVFMMFSYFTPLVLLIKNWWKIQISFGLCYIVYVLLILFGSFSFPFGEETPERFAVLHVNSKLIHPGEQSKTENSGYLVVPMDNQAPQSLKKIFDNENLKPLDNTCDEELFCGLPIVYSSFLNSRRLNYWITAEKPMVPREKKLDFDIKESEYFKTFYFNITGAVFSDVFVLTENNAELVEWSFYREKASSDLKWFDKTVFYIRRSEALKLKPVWSFWLKFDISKMVNKSHIFKLAWSEYYRLNNTLHYTNNFLSFLSKFPSWTRVVSYVAEHEEYLF